MEDNELNPYIVYDTIDGDTLELCSTFYDGYHLKDKYRSFLTSNIFYLDRIYVNKEYRHQGYATMLLEKLDEILTDILKLKVGLIAIYSQPFECTNNKIENVHDEQTTIKLNSLYEKCNYTPVKGTKYYYQIIE